MIGNVFFAKVLLYLVTVKRRRPAGGPRTVIVSASSSGTVKTKIVGSKSTPAPLRETNTVLPPSSPTSPSTPGLSSLMPVEASTMTLTARVLYDVGTASMSTYVSPLAGIAYSSDADMPTLPASNWDHLYNFDFDFDSFGFSAPAADYAPTFYPGSYIFAAPSNPDLSGQAMHVSQSPRLLPLPSPRSPSPIPDLTLTTASVKPLSRMSEKSDLAYNGL
ncbi:hypothetical protein FB45DRAFT_1039824 [Roridomyces roridus]|uniref:Uncharacterized protein n=1 Tax=Roridomyces roridus TaxID=1738132 RepID=A0AAD7B2P8_9AGAR|nr:hypothetical protein FB45DRAFT_1039824 [Roridomyces roridus]